MRRLSSLSHFVVCVGGTRGYARAVISSFLEGLGLKPIDVWHPKAIVESTADVGRGSQVMPGVVVHKFTEIGAFSILNTAATIDHECRLGHGVHVMGAAALAGTVQVQDFASIGTNATVLPGVTIGRGAYVGAGSVVLRDVRPMSVVAGVPARVIGETDLELEARPLVQMDPTFSVDRVLGWTQHGGLRT
jgi:sugar O-acyltransferase (sialic acid O-acetyltransferase NeuD family)